MRCTRACLSRGRLPTSQAFEANVAANYSVLLKEGVSNFTAATLARPLRATRFPTPLHAPMAAPLMRSAVHPFSTQVSKFTGGIKIADFSLHPNFSVASALLLPQPATGARVPDPFGGEAYLSAGIQARSIDGCEAWQDDLLFSPAAVVHAAPLRTRAAGRCESVAPTTPPFCAPESRGYASLILCFPRSPAQTYPRDAGALGNDLAQSERRAALSQLLREPGSVSSTGLTVLVRGGRRMKGGRRGNHPPQTRPKRARKRRQRDA